MDARKGNIYEILNGNKQFLIPVYQRYYSWDIEQCKRLWNDIVEMQKKGKVGHFVGSIVNIAEQAMPTSVQKYMIIDGQQRMTTLSLLLLALRDYAINNPEDTTINARRIDNMLLKNEYESGDERYKLLLTETDRDTAFPAGLSAVSAVIPLSAGYTLPRHTNMPRGAVTPTLRTRAAVL